MYSRNPISVAKLLGREKKKTKLKETHQFINIALTDFIIEQSKYPEWMQVSNKWLQSLVGFQLYLCGIKAIAVIHHATFGEESAAIQFT